MRVQRLTEEHAAAIASWQYQGPMDFEAQPADRSELRDPERRDAWRAVVDDDDSLIGFCWFASRGETVEVGAGLRPDLVGRGLGVQFVDVALDYALREWQ